ncbi:ABC transporter permease subunit [Sporosarcina cascadiensis]|uniref:ABC transporter permease subunit n=1 Tax=Sporosarcina cascadiensis TaxID=2660747 RepID=UPI00129B6021|nr:urea ABC transporter permease [Sporosarcina cascadiensis]
MDNLKNFKKIDSEKITMLVLCIVFLLFPLIASAYDVLNMSYFFSMVFLSMSLWLIWGLTGIFSFGQTAFFGVGAYAYAMISMNFNNNTMTIVALVGALVIAWILALLLGYFMFYGGVNDVFVGLITLCVTLVMATFLAQSAGSQWKIGSVLLGGDNGINNIPPLSIEIGSIQFSLVGTYQYYFIILVLIGFYLFLRKMQHGKMGYSFVAIRENRERSQLLGYNISLLQTLSFSFGGVLAAFSGVLYVTWGGYISPSAMGISAAALPVVLVAAAGRNNLSGVMIFTVLYYFLSQKLSVSGSEYALVILGFILIMVILIVPKGIVVTIFNALDRLFSSRRRRDANDTASDTKQAGTY